MKSFITNRITIGTVKKRNNVSSLTMNDERFLMRALDISRILGLHDRTITRWSLKGLVERKERGKYCLLSVFKHYRHQLHLDIESLQGKIQAAYNLSDQKLLQDKKLESAIKIIITNAKLKEYELELLDQNLVDKQEAERAYQKGCEAIREKLYQLPMALADDIAKLDNPNLINSLLQKKIENILLELSR